MLYVVTTRGILDADDGTAARAAHDAIFRRVSPAGRSNGSTGHRTYLSVNPREFLATDFWETLEGLQRFTGDLAIPQAIGSMFAQPPEVHVWAQTDWEGY